MVNGAQKQGWRDETPVAVGMGTRRMGSGAICWVVLVNSSRLIDGIGHGAREGPDANAGAGNSGHGLALVTCDSAKKSSIQASISSAPLRLLSRLLSSAHHYCSGHPWSQFVPHC